MRHSPLQIKSFFQLTVKDGAELAPEVTSVVEATEKRREANLVSSPHAIEDIWDRGHPLKDIMVLRDKYFWIVDLLRSRPNESSYLFSPSTLRPGLVENPTELRWGGFEDEQSYRATPQMLKEGLSLLNKFYYERMIKGYQDHPATKEEVALMFTLLMKWGGIFGLFPTMEACTSESGKVRYLQLANEKQKRAYQEALSKWKTMDKRYSIYSTDPPPPPEIGYVPDGFPSDNYIREWQGYAREAGMADYEIEKFIVWEEKNITPEGFKTLAEILRINANAMVDDAIKDTEEYDRNYKRLVQDYVAWMAYLPMQYKLGVDFTDLPFEKRAPYLQLVTNRIHWQLEEIQFFVPWLFLWIPHSLSSQPVKVASGHYDETLRVERTQQDLVNEKAIELSGLPRYTAYAKVLFEKDNKQTVWTGKIYTNPLPPQKNNLEAEAIKTGHKFSRLRSDIEKQIRERQEKWRVIAPQTQSAPPEEPPPPTSD